MSEDLATRVFTVIDPLVMLCQWVVFAITVRRLHKRDVFGSVASKARGESNFKSSVDRDPGDEPGSRSGAANPVSKRSTKILWTRRLVYTVGCLTALSIRTIDPLALRFEKALYVNVASQWFCAMFGTLWVAFYAYSHLCAYYVAVMSPPIPTWAPKAHLAYEIYTVFIHLVLAPPAAASRQAYRIGVFYIFIASPALIFAVVLLVCVNALHKRLTSSEVNDMITNRQSFEARAKKVKRFHYNGNLLVAILFGAIISATLSGVLCITDGAIDLSDLDPTVLSFIVWNGHVAAMVGVAVLQWIQWERKEDKRPEDRPALRSGVSRASLPHLTTKQSSAKPIDLGSSSTHQEALASDFSINVTSEIVDEGQNMRAGETNENMGKGASRSVSADGGSRVSINSERV